MGVGIVGLADYFNTVATGPKRRREFLTPLGFLIFGSTLAVVIVVGLYTDRWLGLPTLMPGIVGAVVGVLFLTAGASLCGWCVARFLKAGVTPVPLNPPDELIVSGPYGCQWSLWEQEVPGGDSRRAQERAASGMKAPDGAFNANPGAPTISHAVFRPIGRA